MTASYKYKESTLSSDSELNLNVSYRLKKLTETVLLSDVMMYKDITTMKILFNVIDQFNV